MQIAREHRLLSTLDLRFSVAVLAGSDGSPCVLIIAHDRSTSTDVLRFLRKLFSNSLSMLNSIDFDLRFH